MADFHQRVEAKPRFCRTRLTVNNPRRASERARWQILAKVGVSEIRHCEECNDAAIQIKNLIATHYMFPLYSNTKIRILFLFKL